MHRSSGRPTTALAAQAFVGAVRAPAYGGLSTRAIRGAVAYAAMLLGIGGALAVAACSRRRPSGGGAAGAAGARDAGSVALVCPSVGAPSGRAPSEKSSIGNRHEPARVAVMGARVAHLKEHGVVLWEGSRRLREDALERPVGVAGAEDAAVTLSRGPGGGTLCRHPVRGAATCDRVENRFVGDATQLAVDAGGAPWLGAPAARILLGPGGTQLAFLPGSALLFDGTVVDATPDRVAWSSRGVRREVSVSACALRFVGGGSELLLLAGEDRAPGDEGTERWRALRVDGGGRVTVIGEMVGHPYDAAPWLHGVAILRARRASYGDPVTWDVVLLSPGAVPREERLPMQPRYNLVWDTGFSIAASRETVAVGDRRRLAVLDVARGAWVVTDGPTD